EFMRDEDGQEMEDKPRWLSENMPLYNLEADRARSTARYMALDPEVVHDGEFGALVDTPCTVTVVQNPGKGKNVGKVYENIEAVAVMRAKDAAKCPPLVNAPMVFDLDKPDMDVWKLMPDWVQKKVKDNLEFAGSPLAALLGDDSEPAKTEGDKELDAEESPY
ncbi:MAG: phage replication initiation protein, NGO0469 family, partial [Candidatus Thorarchaeota archaeon]